MHGGALYDCHMLLYNVCYFKLLFVSMLLHVMHYVTREKTEEKGQSGTGKEVIYLIWFTVNYVLDIILMFGLKTLIE